MSEPAWTPGPWALREENLRGGKYWVVSRPGADETIDLHEGDNGEANARLIAAAPTMAEYIRKRAEAGDAEAAAIWEAL